MKQAKQEVAAATLTYWTAIANLIHCSLDGLIACSPTFDISMEFLNLMWRS